jgi:hypothetical protein
LVGDGFFVVRKLVGSGTGDAMASLRPGCVKRAVGARRVQERGRGAAHNLAVDETNVSKI